MDLRAELALFGPRGSQKTLAPAAANAYTVALASNHYENFPVITRFVPAGLRQHFANIYAYCRWSDDLADETGDPAESLRLLDWWEEELRQIWHARPTHPVMVALQNTITRFAIPVTPFVALLGAFRRDQHQTRYETFADLLTYCQGSANPVGRLVLYLCERFNDERAALSDAVCTGLQLVNFWQDVAPDLDRGRIYLPRESLRRFAVEEEDLLAKRFTPAFANLLRFEVERAEEFLRTGLPLARQIPGRLGIAIALFAQGGLGISRKIRAVGFDVFTRRPKLRKWDIAAIMARTVALRLVGK